MGVVACDREVPLTPTLSRQGRGDLFRGSIDLTIYWTPPGTPVV